MASIADLVGIKNQIKTTLSLANTTTASPIDLSSNLSNSKRVVRVLAINPERINPQASLFPLVTCYIDLKTIKTDDIAKTQLSSKRRATVDLKVVGSLWNNNFVSVEDDPADDDILYLMENTELILRSDYNLGAKVSWQRPTDCKYYTTVLDEQTHLRSGVLSFACEVWY